MMTRREDREIRQRGSPELIAMLDQHKRDMQRLHDTYHASVSSRRCGKLVQQIVAEIRDQWERGEVVSGDELADLIEAKFGGRD